VIGWKIGKMGEMNRERERKRKRRKKRKREKMRERQRDNDIQMIYKKQRRKETNRELEVNVLVLPAALLNGLVQRHRHGVDFSVGSVPPTDVENLHTSTIPAINPPMFDPIWSVVQHVAGVHGIDLNPRSPLQGNCGTPNRTLSSM
jgi:type VI protein secretion system component VasA